MSDTRVEVAAIIDKRKHEKSKTLVLIPCYNARRTIEHVIKRIPKRFGLDLLVVDDGSQDNVFEILKNENTSFVRHRKNLGYGAAQKTGVLLSLRMGYDNVVILHADGQYPPEKIPLLVSPIQRKKADIVIGSRMLQGSGREEMPIIRNLGNRLLTFLQNLVLGVSCTGYHCGFRAYSTRFLRSINFMENSDSFDFDSEVIFQAIHKGFVIKEIPINARYGQEKSSLKPLSYGFSILRLILKFMVHKYHIRKIKQFG